MLLTMLRIVSKVNAFEFMFIKTSLPRGFLIRKETETESECFH